MPLRRALVECAVLSLQDSSVFYPSCKGCFSRLDCDSSDTRLSCSKCGYSCARGCLNYRYRLSVRVARGSCLFGVTVFGNCLNHFFGIHASDLQRLLEDDIKPLKRLSKSALLLKAVEECFIGKHFIFGIKITEKENEPWLERSTSGNSMAQLIATQMILPNLIGLRGRTVLSYLKDGLQNASMMSINLQRPLRPSVHNSQTTESTCGFLPLTFSRSHSLDNSLSSTPPWQQSLGLITSSAEQEEGNQDVCHSPFLIDKNTQSSTPFKVNKDLSPKTPKAIELALHLMEYSSPNLTLSKSLTNCQEEFPLSESLTEFLKDKNISQNKLPVELQVTDAQIKRVDNIQVQNVCDKLNKSKISSTEPNEAGEDEQSESSVYNCSADLFSNSPRMNMSEETFNISHFPRVCVPLPTIERHFNEPTTNTLSTGTSKQFKKNKKCSTPKKQKLLNHKCSPKSIFHLNANLNFIESSPIEKGLFVPFDLSKCEKDNILNDRNWVTHHYSATPTRRCRKSQKFQKNLWLSSILKRRSNCFGKDNSLIVPPTPTGPCKTSLKPESVIACKLSCCTVEKNECSNADKECDWSKDLFSDSI